MPKVKISEYSSTANSNTDVASINIDEGCAPSGINNAIRAVMGHLKDFQTGAVSDPLTVGGVLTVTGGSAAAPAITTSGDTNTGVLFPAADTVAITTGGTERARVDSSGNLGLGVTPSAWSGFKALQIGTGGALANPNSLTRVDLTTNSYYNGSQDTYIGTGAATSYRQNGGQHIWYYAASGSAGGAISFNEAGRFDTSGNLLVGGTAQVFGEKLLLKTASGDCYTTMSNGTGSVYVGWSNSGFGFMGTATNHAQTFYTNGTERARIDSSGNLLVGTTSNLNNSEARLQVKGISTGDSLSVFRIGDSRTAGNILFQNASTTQVGYIQILASSTVYATSSDYRLKEDVLPMTGALAKVALLKPVTYKWKVDGFSSQGFIAHELAEVVPECVTGEKDAVDVDGNPQYQGIDTSFLVATLTAAIQEQQALITSLTARITALEGN
jgi:hypothetical protein